MTIAGNLDKIEERLFEVCRRTGRKRDEITLMGVSKFEPVEVIKEAFDAGIRCFGESRVKEASDKFGILKEENPLIRLHLIGHLQRNKAKQSMLLFDCIQSVDRNELILELAKYATLRDKPIEVLLELHTGEETKSGYENIDALLKAAETLLSYDCFKPIGLMTMAPFTQETDIIRSSFRLLGKAQKELQKRFPLKENWACLSMGMSNDFEIAIEEGSTMLRIGSAIFRKE